MPPLSLLNHFITHLAQPQTSLTQLKPTPDPTPLPSTPPQQPAHVNTHLPLLFCFSVDHVTLNSIEACSSSSPPPTPPPSPPRHHSSQHTPHTHLPLLSCSSVDHIRINNMGANGLRERFGGSPHCSGCEKLRIKGRCVGLHTHRLAHTHTHTLLLKGGAGCLHEGNVNSGE